MKKLLVASAIALFSLSNAQIAKGTTYISGQVGYEGSKNNNNDVTNDTFGIVPTVGYFVSSDVAVGVGVGYVSASQTSPSVTGEVKNSTSAFIVEPFARKYWNIGEKLFFFGQLSVPMAFGNDKVKVEGNEVSNEKFSSFGVTVKPGLDYFLNNNWSIEATIGEFGYETAKYKNAESVDNYGFGLNLNSVTLGVKYVFNNAK